MMINKQKISESIKDQIKGLHKFNEYQLYQELNRLNKELKDGSGAYREMFIDDLGLTQAEYRKIVLKMRRGVLKALYEKMSDGFVIEEF